MGLSVLHIGSRHPGDPEHNVLVPNVAEALLAMRAETFDAVVIDATPGGEGAEPLDVVNQLCANDPALPVVVSVPADVEVDTVDLLRAGADEVVRTDEDLSTLIAHLARTADERRAADQRRSFAARHDPLTGAVTGPVLRDRLLGALARAARRHEPLGLVTFDVDGLSQVNATIGHDAGDEVLRTVGARLLAALREVDTAGRLGGDEFVVVLENVGTRSDCKRVVERLQRACTSPLSIGGQRIEPTVSAGVAMWPDHAAAPEALRAASNQALDAARQEGPGTMRFAQPIPRSERLSASEVTA